MTIKFLAALACLATAALFAQEFRGTLSGSVTDAQGAAIAQVKVTATETRTGNKSETVSQATGEYTVPFLTPGEYQIAAEAPGFKQFVRRGITLSMGEHPVIDIRMEVGQAAEKVTVTAEAPMLESSSGSVGQVITTEEVEDFPLNGRTPLMLTRLSLGVLATAEPGQVRPFDNSGVSSFSMGGAPSASNELLLNGAPDAGFAKQIAYSPPQDAVQEVRVQTFESDAAYGHTGGGTANHITKGGTNSLHGSAYDFNQVSFLAANSFYTNKLGVGKPVTHYNQYGVSAGAPVFIPKVVNGKNRIFWFFAYESIRDAIPASNSVNNGATVTTVPTAAERTGDFSALLPLSTAASSYAIYDPATGVVSSTHVARTPFPNNVIPTSRLNPVALNYLKYYPLPNTPGQPDGYQNYAVTATDQDIFDNQYSRVDFNVSDNNKIFADFRHNHRTDHYNEYLGNLGFAPILYRTNWGSSLDDVYTLSPTTVIDIRANWTRFQETYASLSDGFDPTTLGFPSYIASTSEFVGMPYIQFGSCGSFTSFQCQGMNADSNTPWDIYQLFGDVMKIHGNQTIKMGADMRVYRESTYAHGNSAGTYTFNSNWTDGPLNNAAASPFGQDFAAFMLGLPSSGSIDLNTHSSTQQEYYAFFVQDDWRVRRNLTLNLGVRWEHESPAVERFNRAVDGFNPAAVNPVSSAATAAYAKNPISQVPASQFNALGGLTFSSSGSRDVYHTDSKIFSPRAGFAWTPGASGSKTVFRGGFGLFVAPNGINGSLALNQEGFSQTTQFVATNNSYVSPAATLSNPFPGGILLPAGASNGAGTFLGQQVTFFNSQVLNSYSVRWNFGMQRQLPGQMVLEIAYIGNHAVHLPVASTQLDYIPRQYLSTSPARDTATINRLTGTVTNPLAGLIPNSTSLNGSTVALDQLLIPFPQYPLGSATSNGINMQDNSGGESYFESLNVRIQKRYTHGLTLINNFIWNKLMERLVYLNDSDPAPEKRVSADSRPLREVLAASYEVPVGRGKLLNPHSRIVNAVVGDWALNTVLTLQSGPPIAWGNVIYYGGPLQLNPHQPNGPTFNLADFNMNSSQQLSDNIRTFDTQFNNLRRDPTKNLDVSMLKKFPLGEHKYLQLRFEAFNVTNRVTFGAPNVSPTSSAFGTISSQANTPRQIQIGARLVW
jgi:hypothetical protein